MLNLNFESIYPECHKHQVNKEKILELNQVRSRIMKRLNYKLDFQPKYLAKKVKIP